MKKLLILFCLLLAPSGAYAQKTKSALTTEVGTNLASGTGITASTLRTTLIDMINSWYDLNGSSSAACSTHQWVSGFPTLSSQTCAQPGFGDLTGTATLAQGGLGGSQAAATANQIPVFPGSGGAAVPTTPSFALLTGNISTSQMNSGTGASSSTYFRGDGTWAAPPGGTVTSVSTGTGLTGGPITSSGTIALTVPVSAANGGTGVNNGSYTATFGGNFSTSAALAITAGSTGQLAYWSSGTAIGGENITSALTAGTNISITGTTNATIGITGQVGLANGGTGTALVASNGGIVYSDASHLQLLAGTSTAGLCLLSASNTAPTWGSCSGAAAVSSVANSDGTLTISPTTGSVVASIALAHANTWTANLTVSTASLIESGAISASAWLGNGIRLKIGTGTLTDTSSSGTVANAYSSYFAGDTIAATNVTTFTNYYGVYIGVPAGSGNATITNAWALGADNARFGTTNPFQIATNGALTIGGTATFNGTANFTSTFQISGNAMTFPGSAGTLAALNIADQTITGGANVTSQSQSTGSITVDCGTRPLQYITNGGAFTITAPANDGSCILLVTNNSSAGAITFSSFLVGSNTGDSLTTTNTNKFMIWIGRVNGSATYSIKALQ